MSISWGSLRLLFPRYTPDTAPACRPLTPVTALRHLTAAGYSVPALDRPRVEKILTWITALPAFELTYATTDQALAMLDTLLATPAQE